MKKFLVILLVLCFAIANWYEREEANEAREEAYWAHQQTVEELRAIRAQLEELR